MNRVLTGVFLNCKKCNKEMYVIQSLKETKKFCSASCRHKKEPKNHKKHCKKCSIGFKTTTENRTQLYCSLNCFYDRKFYIGETYYILYKTINIVNNKEYIGVHKTGNLEDGYIGNGIFNQSIANRLLNKKLVKSPFVKAVVKYGYENFKREVIKFFSSYEELLIEEGKIVDIDYVNRKDTYNIKVGGNNTPQPDNMKYYDLTDSKGVQYKGKNIKDFCITHNLKYVGILSLVRRELKTSQGFQNTITYKPPQKYIIVNMETNKVFDTSNLRRWCENNAKELIVQKSSTKLHSILSKRQSTTLNKWWVCKKEDWTGVVELTHTEYKYDNKYKVIDNNGIAYSVGNLRDFCKTHSLDPTVFREMLKGNKKSYKKFKIHVNTYKNDKI